MVVTALMVLGAGMLYLIGVVRGSAKPRVVSWFTWSLLNFIGSAASFSDGHYPAAVYAMSSGVMCGLVAIFGFKDGDRRFSTLDVVCQVGALAGVVLWVTLHSPASAVIAQIVVSFIGTLPTFVHCWRRPREEVLATYALYGISGLVVALLAGTWAITGIAFPLWVVASNAVICGMIVVRINVEGAPGVTGDVVYGGARDKMPQSTRFGDS